MLKQASIEAAVSVRGLVKRFDALSAVDGIDLEIQRGECYGILGPNGAGKTTTLEVLEGLQNPTAGTVRLFGQTWGENDHQLRERLGIALQETQLPDKQSVTETIRLFRSFYREGRSIDEVLAAVGLEEKRHVWAGKLSGGQRQRLALACALVGNPDLLFLDEPTTGLDPQSRRQIWDLVVDYRKTGGTVILTTHYMDEAERLCDRIAIIDRGKIIALGTPDQLIAGIGGNAVVEVVTDPPAKPDAVRALPGVCDVQEAAGRLRITLTNLALNLPGVLECFIAEGIQVRELSTHRASLEDVFVQLTGRKLRDT